MYGKMRIICGKTLLLFLCMVLLLLAGCSASGKPQEGQFDPATELTAENSLYYTSVHVDGIGCIVFDSSPLYIPEGSIFVLPPDEEYDSQIVFEAGTNVETAKETTLAWNIFQSATRCSAGINLIRKRAMWR